jgi:hypothetical protein
MLCRNVGTLVAARLVRQVFAQHVRICEWQVSHHFLVQALEHIQRTGPSPKVSDRR